MKSKVTEDEFIALWEKHRGAGAMAMALGIGERAVHLRRKTIEARRKITLVAADPRSLNYYPHLSPSQHSAKFQLSVKNGSVVVFSDAHFWPGVRTTAFKGLLHVIKTLQPAAVINNGDAFDGASISRHPRIGWDSKPSVIDELKCCKDRLSEIEEIAGKAKLLWPLGNHDARFENYLAANAPQYQNVSGFKLRDHFLAWEPCWATWINNDVVVKHRYKGGIHATHNNTVTSGKTIVTGHLHSLKVTPYDDYNGTRFGVDTGTLADPSGPQFEDYLETNPTNWRSGFVVLSFVNGRMLWPEVVRVFDDVHIEFRGTLINVFEL